LELELVVLDRILEATTKKGRQLFEEKKVHRLLKATVKRSSTFVRKECTPDKILATPMPAPEPGGDFRPPDPSLPTSGKKYCGRSL